MPFAAIFQPAEIKATLRLALPVMLARAGLPVFVIVDTLTVGRVGAEELAYLSLGVVPTLTLMLVGVGILQGGMILTAQAFGAGDLASCGKIFRVNLIHALGIGGLFGGLCLALPVLLSAVGIAPDLVEGASHVARQVAWSMPFMLGFIACQYFLEAIKRPGAGFAVIAGANLLNVPLNLYLVHHLHLGAAGATMGTSALRVAMFLAMVLALMFFVRDHKRFDLHFRLREIWSPAALKLGRRIRRLGAPVGFVQFVETSTLTILALFAGRLGAVASATHQVSMNVNQFIYMSGVGMAAATAIRVAHAVGDGDGPGVRHAGYLSAGLMIAMVLPVSILLSLMPRGVAELFTHDIGVLDVAEQAIRVVALVALAQSLMAVFVGALRGMGDVIFTLKAQAAIYWGLLVPTAYGLGIAQKWGVPGLILGLFVGVSCACVVYATRFTRHSLAPVERQ
ncbi:MAG: MATE family efflux transporter [Alphaproteobacteria bacterium]|nr:MAG: MATE family efflux transporter [Alphaproteobacteria bacterium]